MCEKQGWIYTTANQGQTWIISPLPAGRGIDAQFINPSHGWLVVENDFHGQLYQTTDGGQTWTLLMETGWLDAQLDFINARTGWLLACRSYGCVSNPNPLEEILLTLFKTTDGGQTWQSLEPQVAP